MSLFGSSATASANATAPSVAAGIKVQTSIAGKPVQIVYGSNRVSGNLIWYGDFNATQASSGAGKGGPTSGATNTSYNYSTAFLLGVCQGPITGMNQVWASKSTAISILNADLGLIYGTPSQPALGFLDTLFPDQALGYSELCYVASNQYQLGTSAELPNFNFEVLGILAFTGGPYGDANPALVVSDFLTNPNYGAGFPAEYLGDLTNFEQYCNGQGLWISPVFDENQDAASLLDDIATSCNAAFVWSGGLLNIVPYGDMALTGYTPPAAPIFALTDDDFIASGSDDPVTIERARPADQENAISLEYLNRWNAYNSDLVQARDEASIAQFGLRQSASPAAAHYFCDPTAAQTSVSLQLARKSVRNQYSFKLGWRYCMLDPMDIVAISDARLGIDQQWVRILSIDEQDWSGKDGGVLSVTAEEYLEGTGQTALYNFEQGSGYQPNYNAPAPRSFAPAFVEPTFQLTGGDPELWMALAGPNGSWGGADIWVSFDGSSYTHLVSVSQSARYGITTTALDEADTGYAAMDMVGVDLSQSAGQLTSSPGMIAATANTSLCAIGPEFLSYASVVQTGNDAYQLTGLNRGQFDTQPIAQTAGSSFVRCDDTLTKITLQAGLIGKTIYVKVLDRNAWGIGQPTLDEVEPYTYVWQGLAYTEALGPIENLNTVYVGSIQTLSWDLVDDPRQPMYEIRQGSSWSLGVPVGISAQPSFALSGNGTFWVAAKYVAPTGYVVYGAAASLVVTGSIIVRNLLASFDEATSGWTGTCDGTAIIAGNLQLAGSGNILSSANILIEPDLLDFGGLGNSGTYTVPSIHVINAQRVLDSNISISWSAQAVSIYDNFLTIADVLVVSDILGTDNGPMIAVTPRIQVAQADGSFAAWQNFLPGQYSGQYFNFGLQIATSNPEINCVVSDFSVMTDVPDRVDTGTNVAVSATGLTVTYASPFNVTPNVQVTILGATAGDDAIITKTTDGFTVQIVNAGAGVARSIDWAAQGF
jgi:hypothetical protein